MKDLISVDLQVFKTNIINDFVERFKEAKKDVHLTIAQSMDLSDVIEKVKQEMLIVDTAFENTKSKMSVVLYNAISVLMDETWDQYEDKDEWFAMLQNELGCSVDELEAMGIKVTADGGIEVVENEKSVNNSNIVTIIYDLKTHRAQADDGVHGKAGVDFPNHLMSYDGQQYVVDALHWTGTKYTVSGSIKPMSNVKDDPRIDGWIAHRQVSNVMLGYVEETVNQGQEQKSIDDVISQVSDRSAATNIDKDTKIKATTIYFTTTDGEDATQFDTQDTAELLELFVTLLKENNLELVSVDGIDMCELEAYEIDTTIDDLLAEATERSEANSGVFGKSEPEIEIG